MDIDNIVILMKLNREYNTLTFFKDFVGVSYDFPYDYTEENFKRYSHEGFPILTESELEKALRQTLRPAIGTSYSIENILRDIEYYKFIKAGLMLSIQDKEDSIKAVSKENNILNEEIDELKQKVKDNNSIIDRAKKDIQSYKDVLSAVKMEEMNNE